MSFETTVLLLTWVAILLLGLAVAGLLRQVHLLAKGQAAGLPAFGPPNQLPAPALDDARHAAEWPKPAVLLFADRDCSVCELVLPEYSLLAKKHSAQLEFIAVFGSSLPNGADLQMNGHVKYVVNARRAFQRYRISVTPFATFVNARGYVERSGPVGSEELLTAFVGTALSDLSREVAS
jgi:hypothetical protein